MPQDSTKSKEKSPCFGLLRRRSCLVPTWRGVMLFVLVGGLMGAVILGTLHGFLAVTERTDGDALVVEGWMPDYGYEAAIAEFNRRPYRIMYVTGGPLERGSPLSEYKSYAELGTAVMLKMGMTSNAIQAVPAPRVQRDRTYASAKELQHWLRAHEKVPPKLNVVSFGPHARRTRLLFQTAFGSDAQIGIVALADRDYDPHRWWASSQGFRDVTGEAIAYLYARILFRAKEY